jgi:hypothetical protein
MARKRLPALSMQEMRDIRRAVASLIAADTTIKRSSSPSAPAVCKLIHDAIMVMGPLYDRLEAAYLEILKAPGLENLRERRAEADASAALAALQEATQAEPQED